jgi:hypothetical protein
MSLSFLLLLDKYSLIRSFIAYSENTLLRSLIFNQNLIIVEFEKYFILITEKNCNHY